MGLGSKAFASSIMIFAFSSGLGHGLRLPAHSLNLTNEYNNKRLRQPKASKKKRGKAA